MEPPDLVLFGLARLVTWTSPRVQPRDARLTIPCLSQPVSTPSGAELLESSGVHSGEKELLGWSGLGKIRER